MDRQRLFAVCNSSESRFIIFCRPDSLCVRYSLLVVGAVGDFWRSNTMTAPVDPVETIFWHRSLRPRSLLPARCITIRRKGPNWEVLDDIKCPPRLARRRLTTKTRLPRARIGARYFPTFHRTLRLRLQRRARRSARPPSRAAVPADWRSSRHPLRLVLGEPVWWPSCVAVA